MHAYVVSLARLSLVILSLVPAFVTPAVGQTTTGTITGVVSDTGGGALAGAVVTVTSTATGLTRTVVTDAGGRYALPGLSPGTYELKTELSGFKPEVRRDIILAVNQTLALALTLQPGLTESVNVIAASEPIVNTSTSELSYLVGQEAIERLPLNGRNYTDLALLQPGVVAYPHRDGGSVVAHGLGISVNGQDPRANVYLLDGTLQNDFTNGPAGSAAGTALGMDGVREFRVEANAYSAEFGRNSGGQINVLTKSGSNDFDGSLFEYHRNDALDAKNYFDTAGKPDFHRNQFGGSVGGPLQRNRTFFFLNYEALIERLGRTISTVVPDDNARLGILPTGAVGVNPAVAPFLAEFPRANGPLLGQGLAVYNFPFAQTLDQQFVQGRFDLNAGSNHQLFARYTFDDANQYLPDRLSPVPARVRVAQPVLHRRASAGSGVGDLEHHADRLQPDPHRAERRGQHHPAAPGVRARPRVHRRHRHRRPQAVRAAELREPAAGAERVQRPGRSGPHPRPAPVQDRRPGGALPGQHGQPDLQPGHLRLPEPQRLPAQRAEQLRRPDPRGAVRSLLALHAVRPLRAGRNARQQPAHGERRAALRSRRRCRPIAMGATRRCRT